MKVDETFFVHIKLMSALPNAIIACGREVHVLPLKEEEVKLILQKVPFKSCVGHETTAALFNERLGRDDIICHRMNIVPQSGDTFVAGLFTPPRRLAEGELWTEEEILSFTIKWVRVDIF